MRSFGPAVVLAVLAMVVSGCSEVSSSKQRWRSEGQSSTVAPQWGSPASVERVIDGDSIELRVDGEIVEARLSGFNAPELYGDDNSKTCQGLEAKRALENAVGGSSVEFGTVRFLASEQDRFGRTLGQLAVDGYLVVESLIDEGWGFATANEASHRSLMKGAAEGRRGVWGDTCGQSSSATPSIHETHVDAEGDDRSNLNDEWIEITNNKDEAIDLSTWTIRDQTYGHRFGLEGSLAPGANLRIRSGRGTNSSTETYLGEGYPVWSNSSETVVLVDGNGVFADWLFID